MSALVFDIETVPLASALAAPYPKEKREPPANYKKEEAIAGWYEKDELAWKAERAKECSLSPRLGRIVAAGRGRIVDGLDVALDVMTAPAEADESAVLEWLWGSIEDARGNIVTFNGLGFDVPFFLFRSLLHGIKPTVTTKILRDWNRRYSYGPHYDVRAVLTGWDNRTSGTLSDWADCLGCNVEQTVGGSDIHELYNAGDFDAIAEHCRADVETTAQLYRRVAAMYGECGGAW